MNTTEDEKLKRQIRILRDALEAISECDLTQSNCSSLEVGSRRVRNVARRALEMAGLR